ncbi:hypothetical protein R3P38DRAFT_3206483 [Favolaschia claudopus]|uniref:Uncharacterized protein n=1 Tax=Favolaschia claudopus TaxID=2862362 RepID=A0AAW0AN20_9AGAR
MSSTSSGSSHNRFSSSNSLSSSSGNLSGSFNFGIDTLTNGIPDYQRHCNGQYNSPPFSGFENFSMGRSDLSSHHQIFTLQNQNNTLRERIIELEVEKKSSTRTPNSGIRQNGIKRQKGRSSTSGTSKFNTNSLLFITDANGSPSSDRLKTIRRLTSSFFFELQQEYYLPETWRKASLTTKHRSRAIRETEKLGRITHSSGCCTHAKGKKIEVESDAEEDLDVDEDDQNETSGDDKIDVPLNLGRQAPKRNLSSTSQQNPTLQKFKTLDFDSNGENKDSAKIFTSFTRVHNFQSFQRPANRLLGKTPRMRPPTGSSSMSAAASTPTGEAHAGQSFWIPFFFFDISRTLRAAVYHFPHYLAPARVFSPQSPLNYLPPQPQISAIPPAPPAHAAPAPIRVPVSVQAVLPPAPHTAIPTPCPILPASNPVLPPPRPVLPTFSRAPQEAETMAPPANKKPRPGAWNPPLTSTRSRRFLGNVHLQIQANNRQATVEDFTVYRSTLKSYRSVSEYVGTLNTVVVEFLFTYPNMVDLARPQATLPCRVSSLLSNITVSSSRQDESASVHTALAIVSIDDTWLIVVPYTSLTLFLPKDLLNRPRRKCVSPQLNLLQQGDCTTELAPSEMPEIKATVPRSNTKGSRREDK